MKQFLQKRDNGQYRVVSKAFFRGEDVCEGLLDDVYFIVTIEDSAFKAKVSEKDAEYLSILNEKYWLKEVEKACVRKDVFSSGIGQDHDVVCYDDAKPLNDQTFNCEAKPVIQP